MNITLKILIILVTSVFLGVMIFYIRRTKKVENKKSLWIIGKTYKAGHIVVLELDGIEYRCKQEHKSTDDNKPSVDENIWETLSNEKYKFLNIQVKEEDSSCELYNTYTISLNNISGKILSMRPNNNDFFNINKCVTVVWKSPIPVTETYIVKMVGNTNMPSTTNDVIDKYEFVDNKATINFDTSQTFTYIIYQPDIRPIEDIVDVEYHDIITYYEKYKDSHIKGQITVTDSLATEQVLAKEEADRAAAAAKEEADRAAAAAESAAYFERLAREEAARAAITYDLVGHNTKCVEGSIATTMSRTYFNPGTLSDVKNSCTNDPKCIAFSRDTSGYYAIEYSRCDEVYFNPGYDTYRKNYNK